MQDLTKLSEILDEHIEKGERIARRHRLSKASRVDFFEEQITKSLSHDPFSPVTMNEDSNFYNPYARHADGGFMPHPVDSWVQQGRTEQGYETVKEFYRVTGDDPMDAHLFAAPQPKSTSVFAQFRKSVDDYVIKGGPVPIGTVHTYTDGQKYKKLAEGRWAPVAGLEHKKTLKFLAHRDPKVQAHANSNIEAHAGQKQKIQELIKQRQREDHVIGEAKNQAVQAAASHTKNMMGKMFDGKPPKHLDEEHQKIMAEHGADTNPKATLEREGKALQPKVHHVSVNFKHNGKDYSHKFEGVHASSHQEAIERVQEILKQKLPGHQLTGVKAETPKPAKENKEAPTKSPSGEARA